MGDHVGKQYNTYRQKRVGEGDLIEEVTVVEVTEESGGFINPLTIESRKYIVPEGAGKEIRYPRENGHYLKFRDEYGNEFWVPSSSKKKIF